MKSFLISAIVFVGLFELISVNSQSVRSPCPDIFDYRSDNSGVYGHINLQPNRFTPTSRVTIQIHFTILARIQPNYVGSIEPYNKERAIEEYNRGTPITYRVNFPITSPLPKLTALYVNNNRICYGSGDVPGLNEYVSTISLEYTLYGPSEILHKPQTKPPTSGQYYYQDNREQQFNDYNKWTTTQRPWYYPNDFNQPQITNQNRFDDQYSQHYPETTTPWTTTPPPPTTSSWLSNLPSNYGTSNVKCGETPAEVALIWNGKSYPRGEWPWVVAIYKRRFGSLNFICSGTLVSDKHIITAAHCMQTKGTLIAMTDIVVRLGVYNLERWDDDITVTRNLAAAAIHESYDVITKANDLLVLTLNQLVQFNRFIKPACLWSGETDLSRIVGTSGVVTGWGSSEMGSDGLGEPRMIRMPIVLTSTCRASNVDFHKLTSENTLCAGDRNGSGPCLGDSGGGLYLKINGYWVLRGIVSLSLWTNTDEKRCNLDEYIVFTDTAKYLPWIKKVMKS